MEGFLYLVRQVVGGIPLIGGCNIQIFEFSPLLPWGNDPIGRAYHGEREGNERTEEMDGNCSDGHFAAAQVIPESTKKPGQ